MASAEGGSVPNVVGYVSHLQLTRGLGERRELPQWGASGENGFWRILKASERSFLYDKNLRGQLVLASPTPNSGETCPPRPPVIYAHALTEVVMTQFPKMHSLSSRPILFNRFVLLSCRTTAKPLLLLKSKVSQQMHTGF